MPLQISYMGTKRSIAQRVSAVIHDSQPGPLLDLFSGICAVGSAVAPSRQIWCNDVQLFASTVATSYFTSPIFPLHVDEATDHVRDNYFENYRALHERFLPALYEEHSAIASRDLQRLQQLNGEMPNVAHSESLDRERQHLAEEPDCAPYRLFTITYSGGYFGLRQCLQIDSIRYAIDLLRNTGQICDDQHRWMCLALCQAANNVATTTGHFAQYIRPNERTLRRYCTQRRRSIWREWLSALPDLSPLGTRSWRSRNRVFRQDANHLLQGLYERNHRPAVIYADPPYTKDHYSRYYHLYETLLLYDYPPSHGIGRYRPDRFPSPYSIRSQVKHEMSCLIENCSKLRSRLVLSYPEQGLLYDSYNVIMTCLHQHYGSVAPVVRISHYHSSLGASKGQEKRKVNELLFAAE